MASCFVDVSKTTTKQSSNPINCKDHENSEEKLNTHDNLSVPGIRCNYCNESFSSEKLLDHASICQITDLQFGTDQNNIEIKVELDIRETQVKSEVFLDLRDECFEFNDKIPNTDDLDCDKKNIVLKNLPCTNLGESQIKSEPVIDSDNRYEFVAVHAETEIDLDRGSAKSINNELNGSPKCEHCNVGLTNTLSLETNMVQVNVNKSAAVECRCTNSTLQENSHNCLICDYTCKDAHSLKRHMLKHTGHTCTTCDYASKNLYCLMLHMRKHSGEKPFKCTICNHAYTQSGVLKQHMRKKHPQTDEKRYKCTICDYACNESYYLKRHILKHTNPKPYKCTFCDYATVRLSPLNHHMAKKHAGEKTHICTMCEFATTTSKLLKLHMQQHTAKRYKCNICDYGSTLSSALKRHMLIHTGEMLHKCP